MKKIVIICAVVIAAFVLGFLFGGIGSNTRQAEEAHVHGVGEKDARIWTCSMHPQIRMPESGQCPICGMDLIPAVSGDDEALGERELKLSPAAVKLAEIQTLVVPQQTSPDLEEVPQPL